MENIFEMINPAISEKFLQGSVVFIIFENEKIKGMVNTKEDYDKKINTHQYQPLIFLCPLHVKIAYLFDCLHRDCDSEKDEKTYNIMWRTVGTDEWDLWFKINPYKDLLY
jgi:hypothetical protein